MHTLAEQKEAEASALVAEADAMERRNRNNWEWSPHSGTAVAATCWCIGGKRTKVAAAHGLWEKIRFSVEYRTLFWTCSTV